MTQTRFDTDLYVAGDIRCISMTVPANTITDAMINASAEIAASKQVHYHPLHFSVCDGADVASTTGDGISIHTVKGATATVKAVQVICNDAPSGGDKAFTVDVKKAGSGVSPTSILTGTIAVANGSTDYAVASGTIASPALTVGQTLLVVVAVSGSTGTQGQGLSVNVWLEEVYN